jgi:hypothetical protein
MRTTVTLDPDVVALIDAERARTGESFRQAINRLLRRSARSGDQTPPELPVLQGRPLVDLADVSAVLAALDDERRAQRDLT